MIKIEIALHNPNKTITLYVKRNEIHHAVYDRLTQYGIDEERAIECDSWCELAANGERYYEDDFDVFICDNE